MSTPRATKAAVAARRAEAIRMRTAGKSWDEIAAALKYASRGAAHTDVTRALEANQRDLGVSAEALRELELERLDVVHRAATEVLERQHLTVSHGHVVRMGAPIIKDGEAVIAEGAGEPVLDDGPKLAAIDRLVRIGESRRKLLGLDAPTKVTAEVGPSQVFINDINVGDES